MFVGILTGRPEEEVSGSSSDLLQRLSQVHEHARLAMRSVAKALWSSAFPPGSMEELVELFKGAAAYPTMEDIVLSRGRARGLGHGENAIYQAGSESHGPSWTTRVKWGRNSR